MTDDTIELLPCPFCGEHAHLMGGPLAQETFSVWCQNRRGKRHHMECGTMNAHIAVEQWNTRAAMPPATPQEAAKVLLDYMPNYEMERAALESKATDDEGEFSSLSYFLDFSGQNKSYTVVREALNAALRALTQGDKTATLSDTPKEDN